MSIAFLTKGFRFRDYVEERVLIKRVCEKSSVSISPLTFDLLLQRRSSLNSSNFKSEVRFIKFITDYYSHEFNDLKLYRNFPVACVYFGDFVSREHRFIIEIDGADHSKKKVKEYDKKRDYRLSRCGYEVLRVKNNTNSFHQSIPLIKELIETGPSRQMILDKVTTEACDSMHLKIKRKAAKRKAKKGKPKSKQYFRRIIKEGHTTIEKILNSKKTIDVC